MWDGCIFYWKPGEEESSLGGRFDEALWTQVPHEKRHQQKLPAILRHIRCRDSVLGNLGKKQCDVAAKVKCRALSAHHGLLQQTVHVKESGIFIPCFISFLTCRELVQGIIFELSRPNTNHQKPLFYFNREETLLRALDEASLWKRRKSWDHVRN